MATGKLNIAFGYYRLSNEEAKNAKKFRDESSSISNQRMVVERYCRQNNITLVREFKDDGWSGGNFDRPDFQAMMRELERGKVNTVITKDLSRLGRDMRESSYYAEQFFPEHGIHYIAINDNFDSERDNVMAPFQFAMNEVYLRDGSRKVKEVLKAKRESGQYCACPPYGYKKNPRDKNLLVPDEETAPIVQRIFDRAAQGDSARKIALDLAADGVIPPLKYRVLYRDDFSDKGAARASDIWNYTTVKRILKNRVYLGDTLLGKSKKVSVKSKMKVALPKDQWVVTPETHEPLVSLEVFERAQANLGRGTRNYQQYDHVRKSMFSGLVVCEKCGHSLCSCGTVYKGEREKYWYLSCTKHRKDIANPCEGVRIRYTDLLEIVRTDLNLLIDLTDEDVKEVTDAAVRQVTSEDVLKARQEKLKRSKDRLAAIDKIITKLYNDNAAGKLSDDRLDKMVGEFQEEAAQLTLTVAELDVEDVGKAEEEKFRCFFQIAKQYSHIETLDRDILTAFIDRIVIGERTFPDGHVKATRPGVPFSQKVQIYYKFIGDLNKSPERKMGGMNSNQSGGLVFLHLNETDSIDDVDKASGEI